MNNKDELTVGGYIFASLEDAGQAANEIKKIAYIEAHMDMTDANKIHELYDKSIESKTFTTPIGLEYLMSLREYMKNNKIPENDIQPIPLYSTFHRVTMESGEKVKMRRYSSGKKDESLKLKYRNSCLICFILVIIIIAMFLIALKGETPNIINYKRAITDEYAQWQQELQERESNLRDRELELSRREEELNRKYGTDVSDE